MKITRRGSYADHGASTVSLDDASITWNQQTNTLNIKKNVVSDFNTPSTHDYTISISLDEFTKLLTATLAAIESESGTKIVDALKPHLLDIQRAIATIVRPYDVPPET